MGLAPRSQSRYHGSMQPRLEARLADLYARLEHALRERRPPAVAVLERLHALRAEANPCGTCLQCCTSSGRRSHGVTEIELAYLESQTGPERIDAFRAYVKGEPGGDTTCPYYDRGAHGCTVYAARPFSCRVFGHFRVEGSRLPPDCAFEGTEAAFSRNAYLSDVPLARELLDLDWEFGSRTGRKTEGSAGPDPADAEAPAPGGVERALYHVLRSESDAAHKAFEAAAVAHPDSAYLFYSWGLLCSEEKGFEDAAEHFARALALEPANGHYALNLGVALLHVGRPDDAYEALARSADLAPADGTPHHLMGWVDLSAGRIEAGIGHFEEAHRRAPDNEAFGAALQQARTRL